MLHGIPGGKTVKVNKAEGNAVCVLDELGRLLFWMSDNCKGEGEVSVACTGSSSGYTCEDAGEQWLGSGLDHSTLKAISGAAGEEPALSPCEDKGGVICAEDEACSTGVFVEALDTNSCCLETCVSAADLTVVDVSVADPILFKDAVASISVTVKNIGPFESEAFSVSLGVKDGATIGVQSVPGLASEEETTLTFEFDPANYDGLLVLEAVADSQDDIMEANEENNTAELEVFVRERLPEEIEGEDFVDLMVLNAKLSAIDVIVGEEVTVTADVLNSGNIPSAGFTVGLYANSIFNEVLDETTVELLAPLDSVEVSLTLDTLEIADESEIIVFADNKRAIVEADEENNTDSVTIYLTGEELMVYFTASLNVGETQEFSVTDITGRNLAGATVKVFYPFEERIRTETLTTGADGKVQFLVTSPGTHSFTVSKPGYYPFFGEFSVAGIAIERPSDGLFFGLDLMSLLGLVIVVIIIAGAAYYFLVIKKAL
jgi:hypothetical protein